MSGGLIKIILIQPMILGLNIQTQDITFISTYKYLVGILMMYYRLMMS